MISNIVDMDLLKIYQVMSMTLFGRLTNKQRELWHANVLGTNFAGIDLIIEDIRRHLVDRLNEHVT